MSNTSVRRRTSQSLNSFPGIPEEYLREAEDIPDFWVTDLDDIRSLLSSIVSRHQL